MPIETVNRGTLAIGIKFNEGVIVAVEEVPQTLQTSGITQKIFQVDKHIGIAAAGYIPDARIQVNNARYFSQGTRITYDESVEVETVAKYLADQCHQFTQYSGVRPYGVALIIAGVDQKGSSVYVTDPSGTYVPYAAIAIGAGSEEANSFLEEKYDAQMSIEDAAVLAIAATNRKADDKSDKSYIRMAVITAKDGNMQKINEDDVKKYTAAADKFGKA